MSVDTFLDVLLSSPRGQMTVCNIIDTLKDGVLNAATVRDVVDWWERLSSYKSYSKPEDIIRALNVVRDRDYPPGLPDVSVAPLFAFQGPHSLHPDEMAGYISCVLPAGVLENSICKFDRDRLASIGIAFPRTRHDPWSSRALNELSNLSAGQRQVSVDSAKAIGSTLLWFTRQTSLGIALRNCRPSSRSDRARDALGLVHRRRDEVLLAYTFPASILQTHHSARPTFVDAGDHPRFKTRADSPSAIAQRHWGWTVNLEKLSSSDAVIDGCPERVCGKITSGTLGASQRFSFTYLGTLVVPRNDEAGTRDEVFAARLSRGRTPTQLKRELVALL
jgi:hypothetical protein